MISFLGLITLFLRLSLSIQGELAQLSDLATLGVHSECISAPSLSLHADPNGFSVNVNLTKKLEKEERVEVEGEGVFTISSSSLLKNLGQTSRMVLHPLYGSKAIFGSRPPLYDFFHSWKIHLS